MTRLINISSGSRCAVVQYIVFFSLHSDLEEAENVIDENPIKVDSQILTVHVDPEISQPMKLPVTMTFANDDVMLICFSSINLYTV